MSQFGCTNYCAHGYTKLSAHWPAGAKLTKKTQKAFQLLNQLRQQVHAKKAKNVDILSLSQEVSNMSALVVEL